MPISIIFNSNKDPIVITQNVLVAKDTHMLLCTYYPTQNWILRTWENNQMTNEIPQELYERYQRDYEENNESTDDDDEEVMGSEEDEDSD